MNEKDKEILGAFLLAGTIEVISQEEFKEVKMSIKNLLKIIDELEEKEQWLYALEAAGVDNWIGYGDARDILREWNEENDE